MKSCSGSLKSLKKKQIDTNLYRDFHKQLIIHVASVCIGQESPCHKKSLLPNHEDILIF